MRPFDHGTCPRRPTASALSLQISATDPDHFKRWQGWVMARTRLLVQSIQELMCVRPWPEEITPPEVRESCGCRCRCGDEGRVEQRC